jgi:cell division protein ZapA
LTSEGMKETEVEIYGSRYTVKGDADPEYVRQVAKFVDDKMRALARKSPPASGTHRLAVLAALNIADELFKLRRRQEDVDDMIRKKTGDLFEMLGGE